MLALPLSACLRPHGGGFDRAQVWERTARAAEESHLYSTGHESLLLQYTLTKIESHFISIQQQQTQQFPGLLTTNILEGRYLQLQ